MKFFAHRGGTARGLENTLAAFALAIADECDGFECDVRLTADAEPVIIHDRNLRRLAGANVEIARVSLTELRHFRLANGESVPHLDDVMDLVGRASVECFIELKETSDVLVRRVVASIRRWRVEDRTWIMAFARRAQALRVAKTLHAGVRTNVITPVPTNLVRAARMANADAVSFGYSSLPGSYRFFRLIDTCVDLTRRVEQARTAGLHVSCGIANDAPDIRRMAAYGVDGLWTDDVPRARALVRCESVSPP